MSARAGHIDVYTRVTDQIIAALENGTKPWEPSWNNGSRTGGVMPLRACCIPYKGINILLLWIAAEKAAYQSPTWMTFKQAMELGGCVRKGEKGTGIVYAGAREVERETPTGESETDSIPFLKSYTVFNREQIDGLPEIAAVAPVNDRFAEPKTPINAVETFVYAITSKIIFGGSRAAYIPSTDEIHMPPLDEFTTAEAFYATLAHELIHFTKAKHRLDRSFDAKRFGDSGYAMEELVAEIGAAYLGAQFGFAPYHIEDHASYLAHWLTVLKNDKRAIFTAASYAQKAVDYLNEMAICASAVDCPS